MGTFWARTSLKQNVGIFVSGKVLSDSRTPQRAVTIPCLTPNPAGIMSLTLNSEVMTKVSLGVIERFYFGQGGKLAEHSGEPIKKRSVYKQTLKHAGKRVRASHDWFYLGWKEEEATDYFRQRNAVT